MRTSISWLLNTAGTNERRSLLLLFLTPPAFLFAQPGNDNPCGATNLTVNAACTNVTGTNLLATATGGIPAPGCATYTGADVWFTLTVPTNGAVRIITDQAPGGFNNSGMAAYTATACNGTFTLVECDDDDGPGNMAQLDLTCMVPGSTLYLRVWRKNNTTGSAFLICAQTIPATPTPPSNDVPCGATVLPANTSCSLVATTNVGSCGFTSPADPGCANYQGADVWYSVTLPSLGTLSLQTTANSLTDAGMALYSASACNGTFTLIECDDNDGPGNMPRIDRTCMAAGTYYVRVWGNGGGTGTFNICAVFTATSVPTNDTPCTATVLAPNGSCVTTAGTNLCADNTTPPGDPGCASYSGSDVWYTVTTTSQGILSLQTTAGTMTDGGMAIYSATACNGTFTLIECDDNDGPGSMPQIDRTCLAAGTYYVRVWGDGGSMGTFNICAVFTSTPTPSNDGPCTASTLTPNASCTLTGVNNHCADNTNPPGAPGCGSYAGGDIWFTVTLPSSGLLSLQTTGGTLTDAAMALYSATACNGTFTLIECDDDDGPGAMPQIDRTCMVAGTYYVRAWGFNGAQGSFNICAVFTAGSGPITNDAPCSAIGIAVGTTCTATNVENTCATNSNPPTDPGCGSFNGNSRDLWYSFTAPANGIAIIETTAGSLTNAALAVYSGSCASLTLVECDGDSGPGNMPAMSLVQLVPGNTYYIRLWGEGSSTGTFDLCVRSPSTPVGYSCSWMLQLFDTGGDGWGSSQVSVSINGGPATSYTTTTAFNVFLIGVNVGQSITISYSNSGPNQGENSYIIRRYPYALPYFNSGSPPMNGLVFTQTVNCLPPSSSQEDCLGAQTLCGNTSEAENPSGTGNVADLFSANYGCLASAERQGFWYIFRMTSGGNVGMTIDPAGNDDYDWAIWGPYPSSSTTGSICAPSGTPSRCTYASGASTFSATSSYNTGMGHATYSGSPTHANPSPADSENSGGNGWVKGLQTTTGEVYLIYVSNFSRSGLAFALTFQLSGGASLDCTVLPVEFLPLSAHGNAQAVEVEWATATEHNSDYFSIERSADGYDFHPIGLVEAAGESQHRIDYQFMDNAPLPNANYYRLKQVDRDGAYEYSPSVVVFIGLETEVPSLFPNPVQDILNVAFTMPVKGTVYMQIVDATGRVVRDRDTDLDRGPNTVSMGTSGLPAGAYSLLLFSPGQPVPRSVHFLKE